MVPCTVYSYIHIPGTVLFYCHLSNTHRTPTLATLTPCLSATSLTAVSSSWNSGHPPHCRIMLKYWRRKGGAGRGGEVRRQPRIRTCPKLRYTYTVHGARDTAHGTRRTVHGPRHTAHTVLKYVPTHVARTLPSLDVVGTVASLELSPYC